jgi:putative nucleotidyltransferase with HDIG domain
LLEYVCGELRDTVDAAATVAYLPGADGGAGRTIVAGRLPFPAADLPAIVRRLLEGSGSEAFVLINNHCQDDPVLWAAAPGLERVVLVPLPVCDGVWGALAAVNRQGEEFGSPDAKLVRSTSSACAIFIENRRLYRELQEMMLDLMRALVSSIDAKDPYTCGHSERVAMTCRKIAVRLGLRDEEVEHVYLAGLLHDIGKIGTPEAILRKEGRLEPEERLIMIQHPSVGSHILAGIRKLEVIREAVLSHHERIDGKGYPAGLAGDRIPMLARIVGMADAFDAMTSNRPYRPVMPLAQVKREIERNTGTQFDARVAEALLSLDLERLMEELAARVSHAAAR